MTVGADGRIPVAGSNLPGVHTIQRLIIDIFVAILANLVMFQLIKAAVVGFYRGMGITCNLLMAVGTDDPFLAVNRGLVGLGVYMDGRNLTGGELHGEIGPAMTR
jgi:hypothetical protein